MLNETAKFLSQCPYLENAAVKVNYLDTTPFACALLMTGVDVLLKQYADGGEKRSISEDVTNQYLPSEFTGKI